MTNIESLEYWNFERQNNITSKLDYIQKSLWKDKIIVINKDGTYEQKEYIPIKEAREILENNTEETYFSWHIFFDTQREKTFLVEKESKLQNKLQIPGWQPIEEELQEIWNLQNQKLSFNFFAIEENALKRTQNSANVHVVTHSNNYPIIDIFLEKSTNIHNQTVHKIIYNFYYIAQKYKKHLVPCNWNENTVSGNRYYINNLGNIKNLYPNLDTNINKAVSYLNNEYDT